MGEETVYTYDGNGNLVQKIDAKNQKTEYVYDSANKLTNIKYFAASTDVTPAKTVFFTYDNAGNLTSYSDGSTSATYTYDDLNRKLSETVKPGPFEKTLSYTWYKNSLKKSFTAPDNTTYQYSYNENNQLAGIDIPGIGTISHGSYKWTRPESILLPGGSTNNRTYDAMMRTTSITAKDPGANSVMEYSYTFDPMDNITAKATEHGDYQYTYDDLYRLTDSDNPEIPELADEAFTYDPVGNRLTTSDTTNDWVYNNNNELETRDNTSYVYDANGNMTQKTVSGVVTTFFYNIEDRLERVENDAGTTIATYGYDPFGRRLWKDVSGTKTYYVYSDEGLIGEYTETGNEIKAYGWKPGSTWGTDPLFIKQNGEYYFYHNDHLGTPQKLTAVNGAVVWSAKYSSFGKAYVDPASTVENNLRFPGQYFDAETGLHYNYHRYYDPDTGRYLTPDPIGLAGGINPFVYSLNNPNKYVDTLGHSASEGTESGGCSQENPCDLYKDPVLPCFRNGYLQSDPYREMAEEACNKFRDEYPNDRTNCVANCLATNELENDIKYSDCGDRNRKRLGDHFKCYMKCLYLDPLLSGFPDGTLDVGWDMLTPDYFEELQRDFR